MRWLIDECVDAGLAAAVSAIGHDVLYIADIAPGATDVEVINRSQREGRLLLTEDKDFGDLVFRRSEVVPGIVLLRIGLLLPILKEKRLLAAIGRFGEGLFGHYTVVEEARIRSRPLRPA